MSEKKRYIANYLTQVDKSLYCTKTLKKKILKDIKNAVLDYAENNSITDEKQLENHFGSPEEIAKAYLHEVDLKKLRENIIIRKLLIIIVTFLLAIFAFFLVNRLIESYSSVNGYSETLKAEEGTISIIYEQ